MLYALLITGIVYDRATSQEVAPGYTMERWTNEDGLPVDFIHSIIQNTDGYIWLTTPEGLTRFDGHSFRTFNSSNTPPLLHSRATEFTTAVNGEFWFTNNFGDSLRLIQYKHGAFEHYPFDQKSSSQPYLSNRRFELSNDGVLWVAGETTLFVFAGNSFIPVFEDEIQSEIINLYIDDSIVWVVTIEGFYRIVDEDISFIRFRNQRYSSFIIENDETIWIATNDSITRLTRDGAKSFKLPPELVGIVPKLERSKQSPDVLFLSDGDSRFVFRDQKFIELSNQATKVEIRPEIASELTGAENSGWSIIDDHIFYHNTLVATIDVNLRFSLFVDEHQQAWVATKQGLYRFSKSLFNTHNASSELENIYPLFQDHEGAIWTSTLEGSVFRLFNGNANRITDDNFPRVFSFYEDKNNNLWFGTGHGIEIWNRDSNSITRIKTPFDERTVQVKVIQENDREHIWAGSKAGLFEYNTDTEKWNKVPVERNADLRIEQLFQHENGEVWVGTHRHGLYTFRNDSLIAFRDNDRLSDVSIRSLYMDAEGILWAGLNGGGLNRVELREDRISARNVTRYSRENGLFGLVVHSILEDEYDRIWMSSNQGIFWVSRDQLTDVATEKAERIYPTRYRQEDGLPGNEANGAAQNSGLKDKEGTFWFAMLNGLVSVKPWEVQTSSLSFPTVIESVETEDSVWTNFDEEILIPKDSRNITITYTGFNYATKYDDLHFSYKLEGLSNEWIRVESGRSVSFPELGTGLYTFHLKAGTANLWDEEQISSVSFYIEPYFYERASFYGILVLISSILFAGLVLFWRRLKRKAEEQRLYTIMPKENSATIEHYDPFLEALNHYIEEHIEKPSITVAELAALTNMGERNLHRKIKAASGYTPHQYVREIRLKKAQEILESGQVSTISEVAHSVGFSTPFYFSKLFEERFDIHPGDAIKQG